MDNWVGFDSPKGLLEEPEIVPCGCWEISSQPKVSEESADQFPGGPSPTKSWLTFSVIDSSKLYTAIGALCSREYWKSVWDCGPSIYWKGTTK